MPTTEQTTSSEALRLPPHSTEAEQGLLGSLLIDNRVFDLVNDVITANDFYRGDHRRIYEHIVGLIQNGRPADVLTVHDSMASVGLGQEGTRSFLNSLAMNTPNSANARRYAEIVRDKSILRSLVSVGSEIVDSALDTKGLETKDILDRAESSIFKISESAELASQGLKPISKSLAAVTEQVTKLYNSKSNNLVTGVPTGFADLDRLTKGMHEGELIIVAGRPAMGKTTFAMNIAEFVALKAEMPVAIFSMEMPAEQLAMRLISSYKRIRLENLRNGRLQGDEFQLMSAAAADIANSHNLFIDDSSGLRISDIRSRARRLSREVKQLGLIVVDYLQLMSGDGRSENRQQEISEISRGLKLLAKELKCPIIGLSQLNRSLENRPDKRPLMSDLRESGSIEQDADVIIFLYRDIVYNPNLKDTDNERDAEAIIRKQRNGPTGTVELTFFGEFTQFKNRARV